MNNKVDKDVNISSQYVNKENKEISTNANVIEFTIDDILNYSDHDDDDKDNDGDNIHDNEIKFDESIVQNDNHKLFDTDDEDILSPKDIGTDNCVCSKNDINNKEVYIDHLNTAIITVSSGKSTIDSDYNDIEILKVTNKNEDIKDNQNDSDNTMIKSINNNIYNQTMSMNNDDFNSNVKVIIRNDIIDDIRNYDLNDIHSITNIELHDNDDDIMMNNNSDSNNDNDDWIEYYDDTYQRCYYIHRVTNEFQWLKPTDNQHPLQYDNDNDDHSQDYTNNVEIAEDNYDYIDYDYDNLNHIDENEDRHYIDNYVITNNIDNHLHVPFDDYNSKEEYNYSDNDDTYDNNSDNDNVHDISYVDYDNGNKDNDNGDNNYGDDNSDSDANSNPYQQDYIDNDNMNNDNNFQHDSNINSITANDSDDHHLNNNVIKINVCDDNDIINNDVINNDVIKNDIDNNNDIINNDIINNDIDDEYCNKNASNDDIMNNNISDENDVVNNDNDKHEYDDNEISLADIYLYKIDYDHEINESDIDYNTYSNPDDYIDDNGNNYQYDDDDNTSNTYNHYDSNNDNYLLSSNDAYLESNLYDNIHQQSSINIYTDLNTDNNEYNPQNNKPKKMKKTNKKLKKNTKKKKDIEKRSKDIPIGGTNQDYLNMARLYKLERPYMSGNTSFDTNLKILCVLCHENYADMVFFPCEHRCVCQSCIRKEHICTDNELYNQQNNHNNDSNINNQNGYCNCSVCANVIKYILPFENGLEIEKYWSWVLNDNINLPPGFLRNFRHSEAVIKAAYIRNSDYINIDSNSFENTWRTFQKKTNENCILS